MKLQLIEWVDSCSQNTWQPKSILKTHKISNCVSVGIIDEHDTYINIIQSVDNYCENVDHIMAIPKCAITRIRQLRVKESN